MAYRRSRKGRHHARSYGGYSSGRERALQHIEEAKQLSRELGGTDKDVKQYFFSLPHSQLQAILNVYGTQYGNSAQEYAELTMEKWRTGKVYISGTVASRLFKLLPRRMPLDAKYKLTESLWQHFGPSSRKTLRVGNANVEQVIDRIREHIDDIVIRYKIPEDLQRRFEWLSAGDVNVKQDLLNHLRQMEKAIVVEGARAQLPVMLEHLRTNGTHTHRLAQVLKIGKHELEVLADKHADGVTLAEPAPAMRAERATSGPNGMIWLWLIGGAILLALTFAR